MNKILVLILLTVTAVLATVKFPYPQEQYYGNNTIRATNWNCSGETASSMLKNKFNDYLSSYYTESGSYARIKFDDPNYTVSEGIGYGMIFMVYFSNNTTSYQSQFDKLWAYYQKWTDGNGLMNWKISGFNNVNSSGGATDGDIDVAVALIMAYYQFGDEKYKSAANNLIPKIRQYEFESGGLHKPGDQWDNYKNPSYVSPAAFELFKTFDSGNSSFWSSALTANYSLLEANQNKTTGLPSGWSDRNGNGVNGNNTFTGFDYDASRAPWRWAWAYAWYGHSNASTLLSRLAPWVNGKVVTQLKINMYQNGSDGPESRANGTSIGSLSTSLIYSSTYQDKLNSNFSALMSQQAGYYHSSLRLLGGLLMSGNMPNLATATPSVATSSSSSISDECIESSSSTYVNSGAYGWESTTAVLSDESQNGVTMGESIQDAYRVTTRKLDGVKAGETYTLSFDVYQTAGSALALTVKLTDSTQNTDYCGEQVRMVATGTVPYSCVFTSVGANSLTLYYSFIGWWDEIATISNLSLKSSTGEEVLQSLPRFSGIYPLTLTVEQKTLYAYFPLSGSARVDIFDMQGRLLSSPLTSAASGMVQFSLAAMSSGTYIVSLRQGTQRVVKKIFLQ